jgi:hypothetical protein
MAVSRACSRGYIWRVPGQPSPLPGLYGRELEVRRLRSSSAALTILSGDSGVGKSSVLDSAQRATVDAIAPAPRTVPYSGGVLQRLMLEMLSAVLVEDAANRGSLGVAARDLGEAVERLIDGGAQTLLRAIGREALAFVRGQLGEEVGAGITEYANALKDSVDEQLAVRLNNALDREAAAMVIRLAEEVRPRLSVPQIVIALDAGERLHEEDVGVLADLANELPNGIRIRLAVATYDSAHQRTVQRLRAVGSAVAEIAVDGIDEEGIAAWLADTGLSPGLAGRVRRATGGYALHVGDLIRHLHDGGEIGHQPLNQAFSERTEEAWQQLDPEVAHYARRLCVLVDPLPVQATIALLGTTAAQWGEAQERLSRARIFSVEVNGLAWFHEQRRRYLSDLKLGEQERAQASTDAVMALKAHVDEAGQPARLGELAKLVADATPPLEADDQLSAATNLTLPQLAVCAALVELVEPAMVQGPVIEGDQLLRHARSVFGVGELVDAFRALAEGPLINTIEQGRAVAVIPAFHGPLVTAVIVGRAQTSLARAPVPSAAGAAFGALVRLRLEPFLACGYGIGAAPMSRLAEESMALRRRLGGGAAAVRDDAEPNLLVRADYGGRPFYVHVCFQVDAERDEAGKRLGNLETEVFDQRFTVTDVLAHPGAPVPAARFLRAAGRLKGAGFKTSHNGLRATRRPDPGLTIAQSLSKRAEALKLIRALSSPTERYAMRLEQSVGFLFRKKDDARVVAEIVGGRETAAQADELLDLDFADPFWSYRIEENADLSGGERVGIVRYGMGSGPENDPIAEVLTDLAAHAAAFNKTQAHLRLSLDATLEVLLGAALNRELTDALAFYESGLFGEALDKPSAYDWVVRPRQAGVPPFHMNAEIAGNPSDGPDDIVRLEIVDALPPTRDLLAPRLPEVWTRGGVQHVLAEILGHRTDDTRLLAVAGNGGLIWPRCGGLNWPHLCPTGGRLFDAHGA